MNKIAIIGGGEMGGALLRGLAIQKGRHLGLVETDPTRAHALADETGARLIPTTREAVLWADAVILAVKPQIFSAIAPDLLVSFAQGAKAGGKVLISMMAGITLKQLRTSVGKKDDPFASLLSDDSSGDNDNVTVIRVMPNLPLIVGSGATAVANDGVPPKVLEQTIELFKSVGTAVALPESLLNAATGLSGSGPAWVFQFIEGLVAGGVKLGIPREAAMQLTLKTIEGSLKMLRSERWRNEDLTAKVSSPGGTTVHGLYALEQGKFRGVLMDAVSAAARRADELGEK